MSTPADCPQDSRSDPRAEGPAATLDYMDPTAGDGTRSEVSVVEAVGLAVRAHRRQLGMSQRRYAALRHWSKSHVSRLECAAGALRLDDVVGALAGTGYALTLRRKPAQGATEAQPHPPEDGEAPAGWLPSELVARDRGGRRFPAHREVHPVPRGPLWWWRNEAADVASQPPLWSTEGLTLREVLALHEDLLRAAARRHAAEPPERDDLSPPTGATPPSPPPGPP